MPVEFKSRRDCAYVCLKGVGNVSEVELIRGLRLMYENDEDTRRHKCALMDFSQCTQLDISSDAIRQAAEMNLAASKLMTPGAAVAIAVSKPFAFGLGRMWQSYADDTGWTTQVFDDLSEAELWLEDRYTELTS